MNRLRFNLGGDPASVYRSVDLAGRTGEANPHQLVELLYEECIRALRAAAWATEHHKLAIKSERVTRATAILFALESGLDFKQGGDVARTLATLYTGLRQTIVHASIDNDPTPFRETADSLAEIASAWSSVRAA